MNEPICKTDMTSGPIMRRLLYLAAPIVGSQFLQMLYNLTDMFWLGRLGSGEVAATGAAGLYMWLSAAFMYIGSIGAGIGISHAVGSKDFDKARLYTHNAVFISIICGAAFSSVMILFRRQAVGFFHFAEQDVARFAENYLAVVAVPMTFTYISAALGAAFTAAGNSRAPFFCNLAGTCVNMVLDPLLIFSLRLGVPGAAYATAAGQIIVCVMLIVFIKRGKNRPFDTFRFFTAPQWSCVVWIAKKSLPVCAESFLFTFLVMATSRRETSFGSDAMAISRVGSQIESLTWLIGGAFGSSLVSFIGQNCGAKKWDRVGEAYKKASIVMLCYGAAVTLILAVPGQYLFALFLPDPALAERSQLYMRIIAVSQIPLCLEAVSSNIFRGLGKTLPPAVINTTCNILRVPLVYILSAGFMRIGLPGVWIGITVSACVKGVWSNAWYMFTKARTQKDVMAENKKNASTAAVTD